MVTSVDPQAGIVLDRNPQWDPATDDVRTALPDAVVVRGGLSGHGPRPGAAGRLGRRRPVRHRGPAGHHAAGWTDEALAGRIDDVTTGSLRMLALPTTVAPMDNPQCRAAVAAVVDRRAVQEALGGAGTPSARSVLWPRELAGGPEDPTRAPDLDAARARADRLRQARTGSAPCSRSPTRRQRRRRPRGRRASWPRSASRPRCGRWTPTTFYAKDVGEPDAVTASRLRHRAGHLDARTSRPPRRSWCRWSTAAAIRDGRQHQLRPAGRRRRQRAGGRGPGGRRAGSARRLARRSRRPSRRRRRYVPLAENRVQLLAGQRLRNGVVMQPYGGYDVATAGVR